jgi:hypothetical protein
MRGGQRHSMESWKTTLEIQTTWSENWLSDGQKKVQLTLSWITRRREMKLQMQMMMLQ